MEPEWVAIPGFQGYFCNDRGQIASRKTKSYRLLTIDAGVKQSVRLTIDRKTTNHDVHKLIAITFHPRPVNRNFVKHLNGESWDNRPENLEWTAEEPEYSSLRYSEEKMKKAVSNFAEWRTLEDYPHYYFHPDGLVMAVASKVTIMKPIMNPKPSLVLSKNIVHIAKLIATVFVPNPCGYTEIKYLDGDYTNVRASNLAWDENSPTTLRDLNVETMDTDMWKPIEGYPRYLISRQGELVSCKFKKYILIQPHVGDVRTTYRLTLENGHDQETVPLAQLLGLAFIPNPEKYKFVAPRNGDLQDCDLDNLYWWPNPNGLPEVRWVPIKGFPNHEVSGLGIRNKHTKLLMKPVYRQGSDYPAVSIKNGRDILKNKYIHLLIARNLIPNPDGYPVVNHKDGNHHNYSLDNLEWCSYSQNLQHAYDTGLRNGSTSVTMIPTGQEIWKPVGICPTYEVSNTGIVRRGAKIRKLRDNLGYHMCTLCLPGGSQKYPMVHRLVAHAFLTTDHLGRPLDPDVYYEVNHKNKIRCDNRVENLEFISVKEHRGKDQGKAVTAVNIAACETMEFTSITSVALEMKTSVREISRVIDEQEAINGWHFFFADDPDFEAKVEFLCTLIL